MSKKESLKKQALTADSETKSVKTPPHSREAEQCVLGGIMLESQAWDKVSDRLIEVDFYYPEHRVIFRAIDSLVKKDRPLDVLTLTDYLKTSDELPQAGGEAYLFELANTTPSIANISAYADIVRERSVLRQLIQAANQIADRAYHTQGEDYITILDEAERKVFSIAEQGSKTAGPVNIKSVLANTVDQIDRLYRAQETITGLATGYNDFDDLTSGLQRSDLVVVAGRPSMGKTAFAVNIAEHAVIKFKKPVVIFSMEMPAESIAMRMLSSLGRINQQNLRKGQLHDEDWPRITSSISMLSQSPLFIDDTPALTPAEVRSRARRIAKDHGQLGLIVVDYLQLMQATKSADNRTLEVSEISRSLKALAKELDVPVIALSQLNRSLEQRSDKRPVMSDLRESGAIEQDADLIIFIYRDEVYNEDSPDKGSAEIIVAKQRNGPIGKVRLTFLGQYTRFENFMQESFIE